MQLAILNCVYVLGLTALYMLQPQLAKHLQNVPLITARFLIFFLFANMIIYGIHTKNGIDIENKMTYAEYADRNSSEILRSLRVILTYASLAWTLILFYGVVKLCQVGGVDGTRIRSLGGKTYKSFRSVWHGSLIF